MELSTEWKTIATILITNERIPSKIPIVAFVLVCSAFFLEKIPKTIATIARIKPKLGLQQKSKSPIIEVKRETLENKLPFSIGWNEYFGLNL